MKMAKQLQNWEDAVTRAARSFNRASTVDGLKWQSEREHVRAVIRRSKDLKKAIPETIMQAVLQGASMGLSFNPILSHCYMIPRKMSRDDPNAGIVAYASPSYKGLSKICFDASQGMIIQIRAEVVYQADKFRYLGPVDKPVHEPVLTDTHRTLALVKGAYAIVEYANGSYSCEYIDRTTLEAVRALSDNPNSMMYGKFFTEGFKKIAIRRLTKTVQVQSIRLEVATKVMNENEGIIIEGDAITIPDDTPPAASEAIQLITFEESATLRELCEDAGLDVSKLKEAYGLDTLDALPVHLLDPAKARVASYKERKVTS
jgi:recombination protein RecT